MFYLNHPSDMVGTKSETEPLGVNVSEKPRAKGFRQKIREFFGGSVDTNPYNVLVHQGQRPAGTRNDDSKRNIF